MALVFQKLDDLVLDPKIQSFPAHFCEPTLLGKGQDNMPLWDPEKDQRFDGGGDLGTKTPQPYDPLQ
jgi:hypothetical protein